MRNAGSRVFSKFIKSKRKREQEKIRVSKTVFTVCMAAEFGRARSVPTVGLVQSLYYTVGAHTNLLAEVKGRQSIEV